MRDVEYLTCRPPVIVHFSMSLRVYLFTVHMNISQLSRVSLSEDFGKRLSHRCRLFMATAQTALFTSVRNTELVCAKHAM